jgi:hypothetical protein
MNKRKKTTEVSNSKIYTILGRQAQSASFQWKFSARTLKYLSFGSVSKIFKSRLDSVSKPEAPTKLTSLALCIAISTMRIN